MTPDERSERFRDIVAQATPVDIAALLHRTRFSRELWPVRTVRQLIDVYSDKWVNPGSGGLVGHWNIELDVKTSDELAAYLLSDGKPAGDRLRIGRAQVYRVVYPHPCVRWAGRVPAINVSSLHNVLRENWEQARLSHMEALGVNVGSGSNR